MFSISQWLSCFCHLGFCLGTIQMLRNAMGRGEGLGVYRSAQIRLTKVHVPTLLVLRGGEWVSNLQNKTLRNTWMVTWIIIFLIKFIFETFIRAACTSVIAGCGVNVTNSDPTTCINDLLAQYSSGHDTVLQPLTIEQLIGLSVSKMEQLIDLFQTCGKDAFLELYYSRWLHTWVLVTFFILCGENYLCLEACTAGW